jgi:hypothetical protein
MLPEIKIKQNFLHTSILNEGFSGEKFAEFAQTRKEGGEVTRSGH